MTQPLAGTRVVEFSEHGFVPSAVAVLADWGADVVKIERPHGDPMQRVISDGLMPDAGGFDYLFELVNRNERGIALDVTVPEVVRSSSGSSAGPTSTSPTNSRACAASCVPSMRTSSR